MTELPAGWAEALLSEVATINPVADKKSIELDAWVNFVPMPAVKAETGQIDVSEQRRFASVKTGYTPFLEHDVLFAKITPCMENGKMAVVPKLPHQFGFGSTEFHVLRCAEGVLPAFVYYHVSSLRFRYDAEHNMTGAVGQKRVPEPYLAQTAIPLPPLKEQRRIVEKIEALFAELDKGEESLRAAKGRAGLYRQSLLKHAFEGHLTADWRAANPDKLENPETLLARIQSERDVRYKHALDDWQTALTEWRDAGEEGKKPAKPKRPAEFSLEDVTFPRSGWATCPLGSLIGEIGQGWSPKCDGTKTVGPNDWAIIKTTAVQHLKYSDKELKLLPAELNPRPAIEIKEGDFLMTRKGPRVRTGVVCLVRKTRARAMLCDTVYRFRCDDLIVFAPFLELALNAPQKLREIDKLKSGISDSGISLNHGKVRSIQISFPTSCAEQAEIVSRLEAKLSTLDVLEVQLDAQLARSKALRQSILKQAFAGKLVPQDLSDEPASELLKRIKAEKAAAPKPKRRKSKKINA